MIGRELRRVCILVGLSRRRHALLLLLLLLLLLSGQLLLMRHGLWLLMRVLLLLLQHILSMLMLLLLLLMMLWLQHSHIVLRLRVLHVFMRTAVAVLHTAIARVAVYAAGRDSSSTPFAGLLEMLGAQWGVE